ncbi:MOSC domain-containing protein [Proteiniborus sp. MB09-C3]|uniref:MOSC domain-containing protein n=1 Tax=Proteiniborus sp. MB09-C3 TaxID=3050072 RepID=UPI00255449EC|nr:MOSC domain-containing protein [Proteiniborus sp. MB09-C3]WIV12571.1 MOSC domain-containing protein [Proteiniborus sp. MB09-C3]
MKANCEEYNLNGEVADIYIGHSNEVTTRSVKEGTFKENQGLIGDKHLSHGNRQVTIFSAEGRNRINTIEVDGLCVNRFYENLTIKGLDVSKFSIGQEFIIGTAAFQVTSLGKKCFSECNIVKRTEVCSLKYGVIFANVIAGGTVRVGDRVLIKQ